MTLPKQRMIPPQVAVDPCLHPLPIRAVFQAMMQLTEDSGCLLWHPRDVHGAAFPLETEYTVEGTQRIMEGIAGDGRAWRYKVDDTWYAYLPDFPEWQGALTRYNAPQSVPLPPGIKYMPIETTHRRGSGTYEWPITQAEMESGVPYRGQERPSLDTGTEAKPK